MHDIRYLTQNFEQAGEQLARRGFELTAEVLELEEQRRTLSGEMSTMQHEVKTQAQSIGRLRNHGATDAEIQTAREAARNLRAEVQDKEHAHTETKQQLGALMLGLPNFPAQHVPEGKTDADNIVERSWGDSLRHGEGNLDHQQLAMALGILDLGTAAKIAGSRFSILKGKGAALQRALISFMLDTANEKGYVEHALPYLVNAAAMTGTGQLPKFEYDMFKTSLGDRDFYLSPTAEVQLTNLHANEVLPETTLPRKYTAYSECFRAEAGSAGRDMVGIFRQHQFPKVELVKFSRPQDSWGELESLTADAEDVLKRLELRYRVVSLCAGDLGFSSSYTYDLEVWLPSQGKYREVSSCSNFGDFQARRANIRYKEGDSKPNFVHTLNGSALAVGRTLIAILEQYQQPDGSVRIPEALQDRVGFKEISPR